MVGKLSPVLSPEEIEAIEAEARVSTESGESDATWEIIQPLAVAQHHQGEAALSLLRVVRYGNLGVERSLELLDEIHQVHGSDIRILGLIGENLEKARDIDLLNAPPPEHPLFRDVVEQLGELAKRVDDLDMEEKVLNGLACGARMIGRQYDEVAERAYGRLTEIDPGFSSYHFNLGLFYKTRGRFAEGLAANRLASELMTEPFEGCEWNLGICATGAGEGAAALQIWKNMEQKMEMGRFGLPEGRYPQCKVRLAERPLAERDAKNDNPGLEETIWIERLSPCHGIVRSVLYQNLGVDYGDVILFDGAPITYHTYGESQVPVFPHLATLVRRGYALYDFAATQKQSGNVSDLSQHLEADAIIYSHSENFQLLCATCWRDPEKDHERHEQVEKFIVTGRIAAPGHIQPDLLLDQLDAAIAKEGTCQLFVPELCAAAGQADREAIERRRYDLLRANTN